MHSLNVAPFGSTVLSNLDQVRCRSMVAQQGNMRARPLCALGPDPATTYMRGIVAIPVAGLVEIACCSPGTLVECPPVTPVVVHSAFSCDQRHCTLLDGNHINFRYRSGMYQQFLCLICVSWAVSFMAAQGSLICIPCCLCNCRPRFHCEIEHQSLFL